MDTIYTKYLQKDCNIIVQWNCSWHDKSLEVTKRNTGCNTYTIHPINPTLLNLQIHHHHLFYIQFIHHHKNQTSIFSYPSIPKTSIKPLNHKFSPIAPKKNKNNLQILIQSRWKDEWTSQVPSKGETISWDKDADILNRVKRITTKLSNRRQSQLSNLISHGAQWVKRWSSYDNVTKVQSLR